MPVLVSTFLYKEEIVYWDQHAPEMPFIVFARGQQLTESNHIKQRVPVLIPDFFQCLFFCRWRTERTSIFLMSRGKEKTETDHNGQVQSASEGRTSILDRYRSVHRPPTSDPRIPPPKKGFEQPSDEPVVVEEQDCVSFVHSLLADSGGLFSNPFFHFEETPVSFSLNQSRQQRSSSHSPAATGLKNPPL